MKNKRIIGALAGLAVLAFLTWGVGACKSSTTSDTSHTFTSTVVNAHSHTVSIDKTEVQTPPAGGIDTTTSSSAGHSHTFVMTQAQLTLVNGGTAVTVTTGSSDTTGAHTHDITISKWF